MIITYLWWWNTRVWLGQRWVFFVVELLSGQKKWCVFFFLPFCSCLIRKFSHSLFLSLSLSLSSLKESFILFFPSGLPLPFVAFSLAQFFFLFFSIPPQISLLLFCLLFRLLSRVNETRHATTSTPNLTQVSEKMTAEWINCVEMSWCRLLLIFTPC